MFKDTMEEQPINQMHSINSRPMRKILFFAACLLLCSGLSAQTYTSGPLTVTINDTLAHDSTECRTTDRIYYHITVASSFINDTVRIVDSAYGYSIGVFVNTTGSSPWSFISGAGGANVGSDVYHYIEDRSTMWGYAYNNTGSYYGLRKVIRGSAAIFANRDLDSLYITNPCEYSTVEGRIYLDNNGNCTYDSGDEPLSVTLNDIDVTQTFTIAGPWLGYATSMYVTGGVLYTLPAQRSWAATTTMAVSPSYYFIYNTGGCPTGPYTYTSLPGTGADFPFQCTSNLDVQCGALSAGAVRQFTPFFLHPFVSNTGCDTAAGQLTLIKDPHVAYSASLSTHPADIVHGDTLIWNYAGLTSVASGGYWNSFISSIYLTPDATIVSGDSLCFRTYTNILAADINTANNYRAFCLPVVYSFDPNVKEVSPKGTGTQGYIPVTTDTLTYTLHFQNTGTAEAYDIKVIDTLDGDLNPASLRILGTTHKMTPEWLTPNVVQFTFKNIHLPDSNTNEPASHGAVQFAINLDTGLPTGTQIKNTGYIYFDLNPPVITNTVLNTLTSPSGVEQVINGSSLNIFPNPTSDTWNVTVPAGEDQELSIRLYSADGRLVRTQALYPSKTNTIDASSLTPGIYIYRVNGSRNAYTGTLSKQ